MRRKSWELSKPYLVTLTGGETHIYTGTDLRLVRNRANRDYPGQVASLRKMGQRECTWLPYQGKYVGKYVGKESAK